MRASHILRCVNQHIAQLQGGQAVHSGGRGDRESMSPKQKCKTEAKVYTNVNKRMFTEITSSL